MGQIPIWGPWNQQLLAASDESLVHSWKFTNFLALNRGPTYSKRSFCLVTQSCPTLCDPMDCSPPGLPAHHQLLELTQTHVHWVRDAIQPSHPLSSPSPLTFALSPGTAQLSSVQSLCHVWLFVTPWTTACQASLPINNSRSLLKLISIELVMPSNHLILCHPLLLLPSIFPSIRVFSNESALCLKWTKYWSFTFSVSPSNEYSGLISFRMDWLDLLAIQRTLKSLLQHHSSRASIFRLSAFFLTSIHDYWKNYSLD